VNVDRLHALPGGPSVYDRCIVVDGERTERHPITGQPQRAVVYRGTVIECARWIAEAAAGGAA
jgi:hypothetical protein